MRNRWMRISSTTLVTAAVGTVIWVNAGSLTPPVGPVSPSMRTLDEVEPRGIVQKLPGAADAVYLISQPGSYYLTGNVTGVSGKNGIRIDADDVTLDLRGFTVQGISGSGTGIWASNVHKNIAIRNGTVSNWTFHGIDLGSAHNCAVEGVRMSDNQFSGIVSWYGLTIKDCIAENNQGRGFALYNAATVSHCSAVLNQDDGFLLGTTCSVINSTSESNGGRGFNGTIFGEAIQRGDDNTFQNSTAAYNLQEGFFGGNANTLENCASENNGGAGVNLGNNGTVANSTFSGNGIGILAGDAITVTGSSVNSNGDVGVFVNSGTIANCTASYNASDGINDSVTQLLVTASSVTHNGNHGIVLKGGCKVEGCTVANNAAEGIVVVNSDDPDARGCLIRNNIVRRNFNNGVLVTFDSVVDGNNCVDNGGIARPGGNGAGVKATGGRNRIEGNTLIGNDRGIEVAAAANVVIRNAATANTTNYVIAINNKVGPIVSAPNSMAISGSTGGAGVGTTDPWANLSY